MTPTQPTALEGVIKLPVRAESLSRRGEKRFVVNDVRGIVADCNNEQEAHAIAHALNSQGKLIEVCERFIAMVDDDKVYDRAKLIELLTAARSAIQGAKG